MKDFAKAMSLGGTIIIDIMIPFGIGYFIDKKIGFFPIISIIGLFIGIGMAFYSLYQLTKKYE